MTGRSSCWPAARRRRLVLEVIDDGPGVGTKRTATGSSRPSTRAAHPREGWSAAPGSGSRSCAISWRRTAAPSNSSTGGSGGAHFRVRLPRRPRVEKPYIGAQPAPGIESISTCFIRFIFSGTGLALNSSRCGQLGRPGFGRVSEEGTTNEHEDNGWSTLPQSARWPWVPRLPTPRRSARAANPWTAPPGRTLGRTTRGRSTKARSTTRASRTMSVRALRSKISWCST